MHDNLELHDGSEDRSGRIESDAATGAAAAAGAANNSCDGRRRHRRRGHPSAGGGVVADSDPIAEYEETVQKSRALRRAAAEAWRFT